jgi:tetratricopeptide (TPR) repeat protein
MTNNAADLTQQANAKLQEASSPQDYRDAAALLEAAVKLDPENIDARQTLGWVYLDRLHEPQTAYPHLKIVARRHPDDVNARKLFGLACNQTGHPHQAVVEFRAAAKLKPDDLWIRAQLARSLAHDGKWSEADTLYASILKTDPNNPDALLGEAEIQAWRGSNARPLKTLDQLPADAPELDLRGDIHRWNWDLTEARQDYQQALAIETNNYDAENGLAQAEEMGASDLGVKAYQFKDTTHFLREYLEVDGRAHLDDHAYLLGDVAGWRFTNPGFSHLDRQDAGAGMEFDFARWLQVTAKGTVFDYVQTNNHAYFGGQATAKISPVTGTDIYLSGAYNQPFVSSIATVESAMRQQSVGAGLDTKLVGRFSFQAEAQWARLSDDNKWWEAKPQLSYRLFNVPETFIRVQYDYLNYTDLRTNYWTPQRRSTVGPVLDVSIPFCKAVHIDLDGHAPYVFQEKKWGYQFEGGPVIDFCKWIQAKASYYYSSIPGDQGAWSGQGWQASLQVRF